MLAINQYRFLVTTFFRFFFVNYFRLASGNIMIMQKYNKYRGFFLTVAQRKCHMVIDQNACSFLPNQTFVRSERGRIFFCHKDVNSHPGVESDFEIYLGFVEDFRFLYFTKFAQINSDFHRCSVTKYFLDCNRILLHASTPTQKLSMGRIEGGNKPAVGRSRELGWIWHYSD